MIVQDLPNEARVTDFFAEALGVLEAGAILPLGLINALLVEHTGELEPVFGAFNHLWRGTQNVHALSAKGHGHVVWYLTAYIKKCQSEWSLACSGTNSMGTHGNYYAGCLLLLVDIYHSFKSELLEVQLVALVVIRRYCLRVVVDHDG